MGDSNVSTSYRDLRPTYTHSIILNTFFFPLQLDRELYKRMFPGYASGAAACVDVGANPRKRMKAIEVAPDGTEHTTNRGGIHAAFGPLGQSAVAFANQATVELLRNGIRDPAHLSESQGHVNSAIGAALMTATGEDCSTHASSKAHATRVIRSPPPPSLP